MARQLDEFPRSLPRGNHDPLVDFDAILDGNIWELARGVDFSADRQLKNVDVSIRAAGRSRGLTVRVSRRGPDNLVVQAILDQ